MRLIKQLIEKKMELYEEFKLKRYYQRSIWNFFCALNLSLSFMKLRLPSEEVRKINILFKRILLSEQISDMQFREIEKVINFYLHYVIECLDILDNVRNEKYQMGDMYREGFIAISSYEFEI
jgi:hypothetical protein